MSLRQRTKNARSDAGGGVFNEEGGILNVQNGSTIGRTGAGNTAINYGGGIYNLDCTTTVAGSTVSANSANSGGGIYNANGTTTVDGSRILLNMAASTGGGVFNAYNSAGATSVAGSCIVGNSDTSFFNNELAQQIATGNWWGAAAGPNTPSADTVSGNVDVSGFLTAPILGCTPDLQVGKANDIGGSGTAGTPFHWTLNISNTGLLSATFEAGQTILQDDLPSGPSYGAPVSGSFVDVTNSDNIQCAIAGNTLTCAATGGEVSLGPLTGSFQVSFSVTPSAPVTLVNPAGICRVDPGENVDETDEGNNNCPANVVDVSWAYIYLPVSMKNYAGGGE